MDRTVVNYNAAWHQQNNQGYLKFWGHDGTDWTWRGDNAAEFNAMFAILQAEGKAIFTQDGWLGTGA